MRRLFASAAVLIIGLTTVVAGANECAERLLDRVIEAEDLGAIIGRLDQTRVAIVSHRGRALLDQQITLADRLERQRLKRAADHARLGAVDQATHLLKIMPTRDARRLAARDRYLARLERAYRAAVVEAGEGDRELKQRFLTAIMNHGHASGDYFFVLVAEGAEFAEYLHDELLSFDQNASMVAGVINDLASPHPASRADHETERALDVLVRMSTTVEKMIGAGELQPRLYAKDEYANIAREVLVRSREAWAVALTPGGSTPFELRVLRTRLSELRAKLPFLFAHFTSVRNALITRQVRVLFEIEDLVTARFDGGPP